MARRRSAGSSVSAAPTAVFKNIEPAEKLITPLFLQSLLSHGSILLRTAVVVNDQGELLAFYSTPGNVKDRHPVPELAKGLVDKLFGEKGSLSQPLTQGLHHITKLGTKLHNRWLDWSDKLLLRKRAIIETINDQLKNICQIEYSRHRSPINFLMNLIAGLIAYCHQPKKLSLGLQLPTLTEA